MKSIFFSLLLAVTASAAEERVQLSVSGGHETDPRDHGRPVVLIGNALGVTPEIFREAVSRVRPAPVGEQPEAARISQNKQVLLAALSKHGVDNDNLDRVSNYYRYRPESGRLWPTKPATPVAVFNNGKLASIEITGAGAGYSSAPKITGPGHPEITLRATLAFGRDLKRNGSVASIQPVDAK